MVLYVSSHVGVLFDLSHNKQTLLQGHAHRIATTAVSGDRRWVVTADTGPNNTLIVWDSHSGWVVHNNDAGAYVVSVKPGSQ